MTASTPTTWQKVKLGEVVEFIDGDRGANYPTKGELTPRGYCLFLNTKNVPGTSFDFTSNEYISEERHGKLRKGELSPGDFVLTTRGTVGNSAFYDGHAPAKCVRINSGMVILRPRNIINTNYLGSFLASQLFRDQVAALSSGSAQPQLPIKDLQHIELELPEIGEQIKIGSIISAFNEKIELNNKITRTLEQMAQGTFKEWFVGYRFPGYENAEFVDSELGKIPKGWGVVSAEKLLNFEKGLEPGSDAYQTNRSTGLVPFFRVANLVVGDSDFVYVDPKTVEVRRCNAADILLSLDGTVGRVRTGLDGAFSGGIRRVSAIRDNISPAFIYWWLKSPEVQQTIEMYSEGAVIMHAGRATKALIIVYSSDVVGMFGEVAMPLFRKILELEKENRQLVAIRDSLLPKLMSGAIRI